MRRAAFFTFLLLLLGVAGWRWLSHRPPHVTETDTKVAAAGVTLTSQTLALPADITPFPAGSEALMANCTGCHAPEMILNQPRLAADKWQGLIDKMRKAYHAPVAPADDAKIIAALLALPAQREAAK